MFFDVESERFRGYASSRMYSRLIEAFIRAGEHPGVDLITTSQGDMLRDADGGEVGSVILNRIVNDLNKPIVAAAGNASTVGFVTAAGFPSG